VTVEAVLVAAVVVVVTMYLCQVHLYILVKTSSGGCEGGCGNTLMAISLYLCKPQKVVVEAATGEIVIMLSW
jgi:hypothetical protein